MKSNFFVLVASTLLAATASAQELHPYSAFVAQHWVEHRDKDGKFVETLHYDFERRD